MLFYFPTRTLALYLFNVTKCIIFLIFLHFVFQSLLRECVQNIERDVLLKVNPDAFCLRYN